MIKTTSNQFIKLKEFITQEDYTELNKLKEVCVLKDKTNLKLELDFKLNTNKNSKTNLEHINELFYYIDDALVSYIGISSFGGNICEINGLTHPDYRRNGIFTRLFRIAINQCKNRNFDKILLLSDNNSYSGVEFIKSIGGKYDFSEYRMKLTNQSTNKNIIPINLRSANKFDFKLISRQNAIFFNNNDENDYKELPNETIYMIELNKKVIGKINVEYNEDSAFIFGFGILPEFRNNGYGKSALIECLDLINQKNIHNISLDVSCKNNTALNLYTSCGFNQQDIMNYYEYII